MTCEHLLTQPIQRTIQHPENIGCVKYEYVRGMNNDIENVREYGHRAKMRKLMRNNKLY